MAKFNKMRSYLHTLCASLLLVITARAQEIRPVPIASGIAAPTDIQNAADGSGRLFLVQQNGIIRIVRDGVRLSQPFLDIRSKTVAGGERGLLGLAFPPGFAKSQRFYVNYTNLNGDTTIALYRVSSNPDIADVSSETILLKITQPFENHNGGQLRFGPDGYLYVGMGDGGSAGDPYRSGQNLQSLLGKILRLDVESSPGIALVPSTNPFVNRQGAAAEVWAFGLRNPWRFSFDHATGDLWIADVGQDLWEEVDFQPASSKGGENYGWNVMEGTHCYIATNCDRTGITPPVAEYGHAFGCSITGGFVYRGTRFPGLRGTYIYGDYCRGEIWGFSQGATRLLQQTNFNITTFGEDEAGELYVADQAQGVIYRIEATPVNVRSPVVNAVVNAASFAAGMVPGSLTTAFVTGIVDTPQVVAVTQTPLPTSFQGISVIVNGASAPIYGIANANSVEQVNFQTPFEVTGSSASVAVQKSGTSSPAINVPVLPAQPAAFSAVIHNADYTLVTSARPLVTGEYAFVYATGLGAVLNQPLTGSASLPPPLSPTSNPVVVRLNGTSCPLPFAGLAPGLVGVYQVVFQVPGGIPIGIRDLTLTLGPVTGPAIRVPVQ